ncbi:uncharacterized protein LOC116210675 isoform X2 [Punica granatum]|uniref:Uncharacterized protein LOC116210675 isoform X2 n=1 Tax=Punica granatum TaxID=22663 RepID=A0A6P8E533_PUNGR|nr:uncharacterized protein LOC116210675 isoform X2 [Punica granatum]
MAFHVACPITCRRICHCSLGFPRSLQTDASKDDFLHQVSTLEQFLRDPFGIRVRESTATVQVAVPKVVPPPPPPPQPAAVVDAFAGASAAAAAAAPPDGGADDALAAVSAQAKRTALQKKAAAAMVAAEDFARRFESGDLVVDASGDLVEEQSQGPSNSKVLCRMCLFGETEGSERAKKMLSCRSCGKKYHRSCLKNWSQNRDLFHWSSWTCPSCRICEDNIGNHDGYSIYRRHIKICRRTGDPKKFMFCKRCDGAYHCYCQHPPHKNVSSGPYLCPKHTRCHSCGSNVPGNGLSVRWFLGYTCCDACGRLFVKGNYCPVCLKVYRDSESTPMVCCDLCQRWVHTHCDGISDEKYLQFQVDGNLQYICATCRGECYQVRDLEDAVQELWRRKDIADRDLIASLRAAAGLPTQEEIFSISPYSDDEENGPVILKSEYGRSLKFSLKGLGDKSPNKSKDGKKSSKKKFKKKAHEASSVGVMELDQSFEARPDMLSSAGNMIDGNKGNIQSHKSRVEEDVASPVSGNAEHGEGICSINQPGVVKHKFIDEVAASTEDKKPRVLHIKNSKPQNVDSGVDAGKLGIKSKPMNEKKLVIHLGARNRNATNSPHSDASSCQKEHDVLTSNGSDDITQQRITDRSNADGHDGANGVDFSSQSKGIKTGGKEGNLIKLGKVRSDASDVKARSSGGSADAEESNPSEHPRVVFKRRSVQGSVASSHPAPAPIIQTYRREKLSSAKQVEVKPDVQSESNSNHSAAPSSQPLVKDSKPLLKLKFKNINRDSQPSQLLHRDEEKSSIKGQRSKRKRPSPFMGKTSTDGDEDANRLHQDNLLDEIMDANWILKKLGKDAIGKRVEVHQPSDNSWHKGVVTDIVEGTSTLSVDLDDGKVKTVELGKQGVRFVSQKQKRSKT